MAAKQPTVAEEPNLKDYMASRAKAKKVLRSVEIEKGDNDGHVVRHHFVNSGMGRYYEPEVYPFGAEEGKELMAHLGKHLDIKIPASAEEAEEEKEEKGEEKEDA